MTARNVEVEAQDFLCAVQASRILAPTRRPQRIRGGSQEQGVDELGGLPWGRRSEDAPAVEIDLRSALLLLLGCEPLDDEVGRAFPCPVRD